MGATYTRQSSSAIVDGGVIEASDINAEFNQILAAFAVSSGHTHDGTAAEGGPITKLLGTAITIGDATSGTDIAVTLMVSQLMVFLHGWKTKIIFNFQMIYY